MHADEEEEDQNDPVDLANHEFEKRHGHPDDDDGFDDDLSDPEAKAIEQANQRELDRIMARRIMPDAPGADYLRSQRKKFINAQNKLGNYAQGAMPEEGFVEPESKETYCPAPKPTTGFAVVPLKRRGRSAMKPPQAPGESPITKREPEPVSGAAAPASGLWKSRRF